MQEDQTICRMTSRYIYSRYNGFYHFTVAFNNNTEQNHSRDANFSSDNGAEATACLLKKLTHFF